jgi:hypothetical protein
MQSCTNITATHPGNTVKYTVIPRLAELFPKETAGAFSAFEVIRVYIARITFTTLIDRYKCLRKRLHMADMQPTHKVPNPMARSIRQQSCQFRLLTRLSVWP